MISLLMPGKPEILVQKLHFDLFSLGLSISWKFKFFWCKPKLWYSKQKILMMISSTLITHLMTACSWNSRNSPIFFFLLDVWLFFPVFYAYQWIIYFPLRMQIEEEVMIMNNKSCFLQLFWQCFFFKSLFEKQSKSCYIIEGVAQSKSHWCLVELMTPNFGTIL